MAHKIAEIKVDAAQLQLIERFWSFGIGNDPMTRCWAEGHRKRWFVYHYASSAPDALMCAGYLKCSSDP